MDAMQIKKHKEKNLTVYAGEQPGKILHVNTKKKEVSVVLSSGEVMENIPYSDVTSSYDAAAFLKNSPEEQAAVDEAKKRAIELIRSGEYVAIREEFLQHDFDSEPVFIGIYLDSFKDITPKNGGDVFRVFGFRSIVDHKIYGLGSKAISDAVEELDKGDVVLIEYKGKVNGSGGRTFRRFDVLKVTDDKVIQSLASLVK